MAHVWSDYIPKHPDDMRRHVLARSTWSRQLWTEIPVKDTELTNPFNENGKILPRVTDLLDIGCKNLKNEDILVFSNSDIGIVDYAFVQISMLLQETQAGWSDRKEFKPSVWEVPSLQDVIQADGYQGTDVFFFRVQWWKQHRTRYPDMIIAREAWDPCMRELISLTNNGHPLKIENLCWHEAHYGNGHWSQNRMTLPGQLHNHRNAKVFLRSIGKNPAQFFIP